MEVRVRGAWLMGLCLSYVATQMQVPEVSRNGALCMLRLSRCRSQGATALKCWSMLPFLPSVTRYEGMVGRCPRVNSLPVHAALPLAACPGCDGGIGSFAVRLLCGVACQRIQRCGYPLCVCILLTWKSST